MNEEQSIEKDRMRDIANAVPLTKTKIEELTGSTILLGEAANAVARGFENAVGAMGAVNGTAIPVPGGGARQHGGRHRRGQPLIVGEPDGELIIPDQPGVTLNRAETRRMMAGGGGQTFHITVHVKGDVQNGRRTGRDIARGIKEELGADTRATFEAQGS